MPSLFILIFMLTFFGGGVGSLAVIYSLVSSVGLLFKHSTISTSPAGIRIAETPFAGIRKVLSQPFALCDSEMAFVWTMVLMLMRSSFNPSASLAQFL